MALTAFQYKLERAAGTAARKLGAEAAELAPLLVSLLESNYDVRHTYTLKRIGPPAAELLPRLEALHTAAEDLNRKKALQSAIQAIRGESPNRNAALPTDAKNGFSLPSITTTH